MNSLKNEKNMEYCFCNHCRKMLDENQLTIGEDGTLRCYYCGSTDLGQPAWVNCPYQKMTAVKCPRGGKGISINTKGVECTDRCFIR